MRTILEAGAAEIACQTITVAELDRLSKLAGVINDSLDRLLLGKFIAATATSTSPSSLPAATSGSRRW